MHGAPETTKLSRPQVMVIGLGGGVLSGLLGVGGGVIMVPALVLWTGLGQRDAHAVSLGAIIPISAAGVVAFGTAGELEPLPALVLAMGSMLGARLGAGALARIDESRLQLIFGAFLVLTASLMAVRA